MLLKWWPNTKTQSDEYGKSWFFSVPGIQRRSKVSSTDFSEISISSSLFPKDAKTLKFVQSSDTANAYKVSCV